MCSLTAHRYFERFDREYRAAVREYKTLRELYNRVVWYQFEVTCSNWKDPWFESMRQSAVYLHGYSEQMIWSNGRRVIQRCAPMWYAGTIESAPQLPPEILYTEMMMAKEYMDRVREDRWDPYEYAPGGRKYEALLRESEGVAMYSALLSSKKRKKDEASLGHGCRTKLGGSV